MSPLDYSLAFATLFLILVCIAVLATVWVRAVFAALSIGLRTAYRTGLYRPEPQTQGSTRTNESSERVPLLLTRVLRSISRLVPGDSNRHTHTWVIAVLLVGLPLFFFVSAVTIITPVAIFWYVIATGPIPWSLLLGVLGVCAYFGLLLTMWHVGRRILVSL